MNKSETLLSGVQQIARNSKSLIIHTQVFLGIAFVLFFVIAEQVHHDWDGDFVTVTDHDPFSFHVHRISKEFLNAFGREHPYEEHLRENPRADPSHEKHHSKLKAFVNGHWKGYFLSLAIAINLYFVCSSLLKLVVGHYRIISYTWLLFVMWIVLISACLQLIAVIINLFLLLSGSGNVFDAVALACFVSFLLSDVVGIYEIFEIRTIAALLASHAKRLHKAYKTEEDLDVIKSTKKDPLFLINAAIDFLTDTSKRVSSETYLRHNKND